MKTFAAIVLAVTAGLVSPVAAETTAYGYDVHGRLIGAGQSGAEKDGQRKDFYLDRADNRNRLTIGKATRVIGAGSMACSAGGETCLSMQTDGNLVVLRTGNRPVWSSQTAGSAASYAAFQSDGNLVIYTSSNTAVWSSGTSGNIGASLAFQADGNVVIYNLSRQAVWATNTSGS